MTSNLEALLVVQDRDRRLLDLEAQLAKIPAEKSRADQRLDRDRAAVATARENAQKNGVAAKNVEIDIDTRKTTVARLRQQQFETRKNEEFRALGNEIERYLGDIDRLETQLLERMEEADELRGHQQEAEATLAQSQKIVDEDLATLAQRQENLQQQLEETRAERQRLAADVEPDLLDLYERLMRKKGGMAIVPAVHGQCGGCHVKLIAATLVKLQADNSLVQCETCGRILYQG
ncbi:zinc ribbon domain-containing protein [Haloferula sargassicola]|uniref:C4-type zinc ribbon domain-containing protein n=1 Tax=Haloferula sargassicola TaxID=490096 RepID=A0ABP9USZ2_9BACT